MSSEVSGMREHTPSRRRDLDPWAALGVATGWRARISDWAARLALALRYGWPAFMMSALLFVGFTQQVRVPAPGGDWGDVYRYQCFATAFWSGRQGWANLPAAQCGAVLDTLAYNIFTLPQSHFLPGFLQQWMILHSPLVAPFHTLPLEYPVFSLVPFSLPLLFPAVPYTVAFAVEMLLAALAIYALVAHFAGWRAAAFFALVMGIGAYATALARFDLIPAALTFAALLLAERKRWTTAYILLAIATCMKIYPVLFAGPLVIAQARASGLDLRALGNLWRRPRALARTFSGLGWFIGICVLAVAASIAINPIGTYRQVSVLAHRPLEVESVGASLVWLGTWAHIPMQSFIWFGSDNVSSPISKLVMAGLSALLLVGYLYVLYALWRRRLTQAQAWLAIVLLIVVTGKIFSAQYLMWILPFAVYLMDFSGMVPFLWLTAAALTTFSFPFMWRAHGGWHAIIGLRNLLVVTLTVLALQLRWQIARAHVPVAVATPLPEFQAEPAAEHAADPRADGAGPTPDIAPSPLAASIGTDS